MRSAILLGPIPLSAVAGLLVSFAALGAGVQRGNFRVGAARVEITPAADAIPAPFKTILDKIYVRAIVLDDGSTQAAIVTADARNMEDDIWAAVSARIQRESGIAPDHLILSATHSHSTPQLRLSQQPGGPLPPTPKDANNQAYRANFQNAIVEAVRQAKTRLQPARVGYGTGLAYINVNRDWFNPKDQHWYLYQPYQGVNTSAPSDKKVYVLRFDGLNGEPIAIYCNYAVHADFNNGGNGDEISADVAGVTARYVESHYRGNVVALWAAGAEGDQHPIYKVWIDRAGVPTEQERTASHHMQTIAGEMLGEEVIFTADQIADFNSNVHLWGAQKVFSCPGQKVTPLNHPLTCAYPGWPVDNSRLPACDNFKVADAPPVPIRLSLLMINKVALAGISGEPLSRVGFHVQSASPFADTIVVGLANGASGYIPADVNYDGFQFESTASKIKRGCAEQGIVNGFLELMNRD